MQHHISIFTAIILIVCSIGTVACGLFYMFAQEKRNRTVIRWVFLFLVIAGFITIVVSSGGL
jgi:hypothetical protein